MMTGAVIIADATIGAAMAGAVMASSGAMDVATARRAAILRRHRNRAVGVIGTTIVDVMTVAGGTIAVDATMARRRCLADSSRNRLARRRRPSSNRRVAVVRSLMAHRVAATGIAVAIAGVAMEDVTTLLRRCSADRVLRRTRHRLRRSSAVARGKVRAMAAGVVVAMIAEIAGAVVSVATTADAKARVGVIPTET